MNETSLRRKVAGVFVHRRFHAMLAAQNVARDTILANPYITAVVTIGVALLSGLGFIAYRHHASYIKMYPFVFAVPLLMTMGMFVYNIAILQASTVVVQNAGTDCFTTIDKIRSLLNNFGFDYSYFFVSAALMIYLSFLSFLPMLGISGEGTSK